MIVTKSLVSMLDHFASRWQAKQFDSLQEILDNLIDIEDELRDEIDRDYVVIEGDGNL